MVVQAAAFLCGIKRDIALLLPLVMRAIFPLKRLWTARLAESRPVARREKGPRRQ